MSGKEKNSRTADHPLEVNPGYAVFQIARALVTTVHHEDPSVREHARQKIEKWTSIIQGMLNGRLAVGSRIPVPDAPAWATLEVMTGGFATSELLAAGPLQEHEKALLSRIAARPDSGSRQAINAFYLTDAGLAELQDMLESGRYDIGVPEEGALLAVAWLVKNGFAPEARDLLEKLAPFFSQLRFYPIPASYTRRFCSRVYVQDVKGAIAGLERIKPNRQILAQKEAIEIWAPLYDRTVALFLETVEGDPPVLRDPGDGARTSVKKPTGQDDIEGGWPCRCCPEGWSQRAGTLLHEYEEKRKVHKLCSRPSSGNFAQLRTWMSKCIKAPKSLDPREVGRIRELLARYVAKRGTPDSTRCQEGRRRQAQQAGGPTYQEIAVSMIPRLEAHPKDSGLDDIGSITQPLTEEETARRGIPAGAEIPPSLQRKVRRCLSETVDVLVEQGIITSGEALARVLPQVTSGLRAAGIADPQLRQLYAAVYRAFRRRRSLLLLNLEKQIRIEELPWIAAIDRFRCANLPTRDSAGQALEETCLLTIASFPYAILPNKLLQELNALARTAELDLPLVEEVAADIFMGEFSDKFLEAAKRAADVLDQTLYSTYYGIDYDQVRKLPDRKRTRGDRVASLSLDPFVKLCQSRAGIQFGGGLWSILLNGLMRHTASNGMIIEQQQILTSQNLAVLFAGLNLTDALRDRLEDLARICFKWICRRLQMKVKNHHAQLIQIKNAAYAWRQMIFYLALSPPPDVLEFLLWAKEHLHKQSPAFIARFESALKGLELAVKGHSIPAESGCPSDARRFLGWSNQKHWLLAGAPEREG